MMHTIRTLFLVFTVCLLCLPAAGFACGSTAGTAQRDCCEKGKAKEHRCAKGQAENQQAGQDCNGACSDCYCHHAAEFTILPVSSPSEPAHQPGTPAQRWSYAEDYSFTDLQLIWTPPKSSLS